METPEERLIEAPRPIRWSAAILAGLWSIHDDTLGGLTAPLTFIRNQPAPQRMCWFHLTTQNRDWVSPDGFQQECL